MRKATLVLILTLVFLPVAAFAHPPTGISADYDQAKSMLNIHVTHSTGKKREHYLRTLRIYRNGDLFKEYLYQWQKNRVTVVEDLEIVIQEGDVIKVVATDNGGGVQESVVSFN